MVTAGSTATVTCTHKTYTFLLGTTVVYDVSPSTTAKEAQTITCESDGAWGINGNMAFDHIMCSGPLVYGPGPRVGSSLGANVEERARIQNASRVLQEVPEVEVTGNAAAREDVVHRLLHAITAGEPFAMRGGVYGLVPDPVKTLDRADATLWARDGVVSKDHLVSIAVLKAGGRSAPPFEHQTMTLNDFVTHQQDHSTELYLHQVPVDELPGLGRWVGVPDKLLGWVPTATCTVFAGRGGITTSSIMA